MMRSRRLLGLPVIDVENGRSLGRVSRLLFDPRARRVAAFLITSGHWPAEENVLEWRDARGVGTHAITVEGDRPLARPSSLPELQPLLRRQLRLYGTRVLTEDGHFLGNVEEVTVQTETGVLHELLLAPTKLSDRLRGQLCVPASALLVMGEDAIVVRSGTQAVSVRGRAGVDGTPANGRTPASGASAAPAGRSGPTPARAGGDEPHPAGQPGNGTGASEDEAQDGGAPPVTALRQAAHRTLRSIYRLTAGSLPRRRQVP